MRTRAKPDGNQEEIVKALRQSGATVQNHKQVGWNRCKICGKYFHSYHKSKYCSHECYWSDPETILRNQQNAINLRKYKACKSCGDPIKGNRIYCNKCWTGKRKAASICIVCGKIINKQHFRMFCDECRAAGKHRKVGKSICSVCGSVVLKYNRKYCDNCWKERMMTTRKVDDNQKEIVDALRKVGCSVLDVSQVGRGCPDLIVSGRDGLIHLIEVKNPKAKGKLNARQKEWHNQWQGEKPFVVHSVDEALRAVGAIEMSE